MPDIRTDPQRFLHDVRLVHLHDRHRSVRGRDLAVLLPARDVAAQRRHRHGYAVDLRSCHVRRSDLHEAKFRVLPLRGRRENVRAVLGIPVAVHHNGCLRTDCVRRRHHLHGCPNIRFAEQVERPSGG